MNQHDKSAFVAIVGRPNVGKSSILNRLLGQKIAIVSSKPQTTRNRITGVLTEGEYQLVFFDTPGMHKPKNTLGKYMVRSVNESVGGVDCCLLVVEADREPGQTELDLIEKFKSLNMPAILAINKIDMLREKEVLMKQILAYTQLYDFEAIVPVSAQDGSGMTELLDELKKQASEGGHFFDDDTLTDQPERVIVAEIIREKILDRAHENARQRRARHRGDDFLRARDPQADHHRQAGRHAQKNQHLRTSGHRALL